MNYKLTVSKSERLPHWDFFHPILVDSPRAAPQDCAQTTRTLLASFFPGCKLSVIIQSNARAGVRTLQ